MRVAVITAVWKRHATVAIWWRWIQHLRDWWDVELYPIVVGTDDEVHRQMAVEHHGHYINHENVVGAKFNAGLRAASTIDADAVLVMGSDDVFCERVAAAYVPHMDKNYVGINDFFFYDVRMNQLGYWPGYRHQRRGEPVGAGRWVSARVLKQCHWRLWEDSKNAGCDHASFHTLRRLGYPKPEVMLSCVAVEGCGVDIKDGGNLHRFGAVGSQRPGWVRQMSSGGYPMILDRLPSDVVESMVGLRRAAA